MRTRRLRGWRLRTLVVGVAVVAAVLGWARFEMTKPRPVGWVANGGWRTVFWSDRKPHERERGIHPVEIQFGRVLTLVKWSDGAITYYLHWPDR